MISHLTKVFLNNNNSENFKINCFPSVQIYLSSSRLHLQGKAHFLFLSCVMDLFPVKRTCFIVHRSISIYVMITCVSRKDTHYLKMKVLFAVTYRKQV